MSGVTAAQAPIAPEPPKVTDNVKYEPQLLYPERFDPKGIPVVASTDLDVAIMKYSEELLTEFDKYYYNPTITANSIIPPSSLPVGHLITDAARACPSFFPAALLGRGDRVDADDERTSKHLTSLFLPSAPRQQSGRAPSSAGSDRSNNSASSSSSSGGTDAASGGIPDDDDDDDYADGGGGDDEPSW